MISENMKELVKNSSIIRSMFEEGKKMTLKYGAENVYDFSLGNPSINAPDVIKKEIITILENEEPINVHGYMNNLGYDESREKIAVSTNKEFATNFNKDNIVMTVGAAGALNIVFKTLLNPGDEVIVFAPYFGEYKRYIENYGGVMVVVPADTHSFQINLDLLEQKLSDKTKAVIINSPNNPSGVIYTEHTLKNLSQVMCDKEKQTGNSIYLISDEPYRKITYDGAYVPYVSKFYKNTFIAYSFSKSLSLPGERIGYLIAASEMDSFNEIMNGLSVANRILGFVNAPSLFQKVAATCVNVKIDISVYEENRNILYNHLTDIGYECVKPEGAFYLFPKSLEENDVNFCNEAKKYNLLTVPGVAFGCEGFFRLAYCVSKNTVINSLEKFELLYKHYAKLRKEE